MSADYKAKIQKLEAELITISDECVNLSDFLDKGINNLLRLDYITKQGILRRSGRLLVRSIPKN